jgi:hypothetical protein
MPDRWNDPRDDRWRREPRYRQERYAREERSADDALSDYISGPSEDRSFRDDGRYYREHEHDADWDGAYNRGYDLDPYYPGGVAEPRRFDRGGYRVPSDDRRPGGYTRQPPFGGVRASGGPAYARADYEGQGTAYAASPGPYGPEPRGQRPGQYADFRFGHPLSQRERDEARHARHDEGRNFLDRAADRVASWFGGHEGDTRAAPTWQGHRGKGPRGYHRSDQRISDDVHDALTDDAYLDATDVTVAVASGEVTLSGVVTDREAKHRAERIVERISGVDHVQNNLRIGHVEGSKPFAGGNPLTTPGRGFGDSVLEAQARGETPRTVDDDDRSH